MSERRALNYFTSPDFVKLDVKTGVIRSRGGTRMIAVNEDFLRGFGTLLVGGGAHAQVVDGEGEDGQAVAHHQ